MYEVDDGVFLKRFEETEKMAIGFYRLVNARRQMFDIVFVINDCTQMSNVERYIIEVLGNENDVVHILE